MSEHDDETDTGNRDNVRRSAANEARAARLAAALRENLRKRKDQVRARAPARAAAIETASDGKPRP